MTDPEPAALDTSFWTMGHRADVIPYLLEYFEVHVPPAVRAEILAVDPRFPRRRYGYAEMFRVLEGRGLLPVATPSVVEGRFGLGEAEALALAGEHRWRLLINDYRPMESARQRGVRTVSVPSFILLLYDGAVISLLGAERKLELIAGNTSSAILDPARRVLDGLARAKGDRT